MNDPNSVSNPSGARVTLKLKAGARRPSTETKTPRPPQSERKAAQKPGAIWSDEYKRSMQEDMDALAR